MTTDGASGVAGDGCPQPRKVRHKTRERAVAQIMAIKAAEGHGDKDLRPYRCGDHWHTGHKPGSGKGGLNGKIQRALGTKR